MGEHLLTDAEAQELIDIGITPREIVRLRWPDIKYEEADFILWERTAFPLIFGVRDLVDAIADYDPDQDVPSAEDD